MQSFRSFLYPLSVPAYFYFDRKTGKKQVSHCRTVASTGQGYLIQYLRPIMPENTGKYRKVPDTSGNQESRKVIFVALSHYFPQGAFQKSETQNAADILILNPVPNKSAYICRYEKAADTRFWRICGFFCVFRNL